MFVRRVLLLATIMLSMPCIAMAEVPSNSAGGPANARLTSPPDDMFVDLRVPAHQIYLGETIRVAYDVYVASSRGQVFYNVEEPDFTHWYVVEGRTEPAGHASFEGKAYTREPFAVFFVTAMTSGKIALPPLKVEVPYVSSKPWVMNTPRIVEVLPLPEPMPADMAIGNVGNFEISGKLSDSEIRVGDVLNLKVTVLSDSPSAGIELAPYVLNEDAEAFRVYPAIVAQTEEQILGDRLMSKRVFRIRLLAQKAGHFKISPAEIVTFEPKRHQYRRLATESFEVTVGEGTLPENEVRAQTHRLDSGKIRAMHPDTSRCVKAPSLAWMIVAPVGFVVWLLGTVCVRRLRRMRGDSAKIEAAMQLLTQLEATENAQAQIEVINKIFAVRFGVTMEDGQEAFDAKLEAALGREAYSVVKSGIATLKENVYSTKQPLSKDALSEVVSALRRAIRHGGQK